MKRNLLLFVLLVTYFINIQIMQAAERPQRVKSPTVASDAPVKAVTTVGPTILSIIPAQGEPGSKISIFGSGFGERISAYLGSVEIPATVIEGKHLEFIIPQLEQGLYALYVKRADGAVGRIYNFTVQALRPVLASLSPDSVSSCATGGEREVRGYGSNFSKTASVLFDGAVIASRVISAEQIVFNTPQAVGGLHQIIVKNDPENGSMPLALSLETRPEISQVSIGADYVNYYELNIYGRNFQQNMVMYVDGQRIGSKGGQEMAEREKLIYVDCTKIIYVRYPYSSTNKDFRVQVVNQSGEWSQVVNVTAP